ncbi:hypothetical protein JD844_007966 [Phrynosoma platyrhinos]|uniref:Uncharacterized protein n=1 Tax=Phrynosoma platyrhinos TaxID=52577 RepID=A0ABQ7T4R6_PHRPL|nr:hypothetical protein JD844_007966 [Phrynosoma platyrhinos]
MLIMKATEYTYLGRPEEKLLSVSLNAIVIFHCFLIALGIGFANGHCWKQQRRFGIVTMRNLGLGKKGMENQIEEEAHQLVEAFMQAKGQPLDPSLFISNAISSLISVVSFGYRFTHEDETFQKLMEAIDTLAKFGVSIFHAMYSFFPGFMKYLPGLHQKAFTSMQMGLSFAKEEIEKHKEHQGLHDPQDFIDFYLLQMEKSKGDPNTTFNEDNLAQCIVELFIAGTETTSSTLQWGLLLMVDNPDIQERVYKEMEDVLGSSHSICYEDRKKLPYTNAVIHEVQRAKYILPIGIPRRCSKDLNMLGYHIPKVRAEKVNLLYSRRLFRARVCLGEQMARMELFLFFTHLLRAFRFQLPEGVKEISQEPVVGLSMHPHPYKLCAIPRSSL